MRSITADLIESDVSPFVTIPPFRLDVPTGNRVPLSQGFTLNLEQGGRILRSGLLVINHTRRLLASNLAADDLLKAGEGLRLTANHLLIEKAYVHRSFELLLAQVRLASMDSTFDPADCSCIGIPDRKGAVRFAVRVMDAQTTGTGTEILLALMDLVDRAGGSKATFSAVFRLSEREAELAELFSRGFRLEEIASQMQVSLNTARVHLRNVFAKTNCSGQAELMRMFSRFS